MVYMYLKNRLSCFGVIASMCHLASTVGLFWSLECGQPDDGGWYKFMDKLYGFAATVTTIGYGDCTPANLSSPYLGKFFFVWYCITFFGAFIWLFWERSKLEVLTWWFSNPAHYLELCQDEPLRQPVLGRGGQRSSS